MLRRAMSLLALAIRSFVAQAQIRFERLSLWATKTNHG
jgi:hypothetical protein